MEETYCRAHCSQNGKTSPVNDALLFSDRTRYSGDDQKKPFHVYAVFVNTKIPAKVAG